MTNTRRKFTFPIATLSRSAGLLHAAFIDASYQAAMTERLGEAFAAEFLNKLGAVTGKAKEQSSQTGDIGDLANEQRAHFQEMERLTSGARRTARLVFAGQDGILHSEFQVGVDEPKTFEAEVDRAGKTHAAAVKYAAALKVKGWVARDTAALGNEIASLSGKDLEQEQALDDRLGLTNDKIIAANALYDACLTVQNAARLEYPAKNDATGAALNVTPRARFLLDEFPPRDRSQPDGGTQSGNGGTPPDNGAPKK